MEEEILQWRGWGMGEVVWELGEKLFAPHIGVGRVTECFGEQRNVDQFVLL